MLEVSPWVAVGRPQPVGVEEIVYLLTCLRCGRGTHLSSCTWNALWRSLWYRYTWFSQFSIHWVCSYSVDMMWFITKILWIYNRSSASWQMDLQSCFSIIPHVFRAQPETTKPNWWASKEKCPWSHLNQSFLQAGFSLIWGSTLLHILIVFPWSATMTPQMFIQSRLEKDRLNLCSGVHSLYLNIHKSDRNL